MSDTVMNRSIGWVLAGWLLTNGASAQQLHTDDDGPCSRLPVVQEIQMRKLAINEIQRDKRRRHIPKSVPYFIQGIYQCDREVWVEYQYYDERPLGGNHVVINIDTLETRIDLGE